MNRARARRTSLAVLLLVSLALQGCGGFTQSEEEIQAYEEEIRQWRNERLEDLVADDGWLSVIGLFWLSEGENSFGPHPDAGLPFPAPANEQGGGPQLFGTIEVTDGQAVLVPAAGQRILVDGMPVGTMPLVDDQHQGTTIMAVSPYQFFVIERQGRLGLRLRDLSRAKTLSPPQIAHFPIDRKWRIEARLDPYDPPKTIPIPTVLGTVNRSISPGALVFTVDGLEMRIDAIESGDERLFLVIADETSGRETYGGGRYLYTGPADDEGRVLADFNKAHNPPCVFTDHATCFLPPRQNRLSLRLEAGEQMVDGYTRH